jgi:dihydropteroate synthase
MKQLRGWRSGLTRQPAKLFSFWKRGFESRPPRSSTISLVRHEEFGYLKVARNQSDNMKEFVWDKNKIYIMGILNVTPDSFSDGGKFNTTKKAFNQAKKMIKEGANIIDVGGESTRPGAKKVSAKEEAERVVPVIKKISDYITKNNLDVLISIDTTKSSVAKKGVEAGAHIINDVSAMEIDGKIAEVARLNKTGLILMHMKGRPRNMQKNPKYKNATKEIKNYLKARLLIAKAKGVKKNKIAIDPGIGFGKTIDHNLELINNLKSFKQLGYPILIGTSRKSFIGKILDKKEDERINGSIATNVIAMFNGANIFRVHDVKEINEALTITNKILNTK